MVAAVRSDTVIRSSLQLDTKPTASKHSLNCPGRGLGNEYRPYTSVVACRIAWPFSAGLKDTDTRGRAEHLRSPLPLHQGAEAPRYEGGSAISKTASAITGDPQSG